MTATQSRHASGNALPAGAPRFDPRPRPDGEPRRGPAGAPAPAPRPRPRHLRLVDPAEARRRRLTRAVTGLLVAAICAGLFAIVAMRVVLAQGQEQIDHLQASADAETVTQQQLRLQVAQLEAPAQIVAAARSRLGMVTPPSVTNLSPAPPAR